MKKIIFVFLGVLLFAYSCTKEEDKPMANQNNNKGVREFLSNNSDEDRILDFMDQLDNPDTGVPLLAEDMVWNIEATLNTKYSQVDENNYNDQICGYSYKTFTTDEEGLIDFTQIKSAYDFFKDNLSTIYHDISETDKWLCFVNIEITNDTISMWYNFGINRFSVPSPPSYFGPTDYWYYGNKLGKCGSYTGSVGVSDAANELDIKVRHNIPALPHQTYFKTVPTNVVATFPIVAGQSSPSPINPINPNDATPNDNNFDYLLAHGYSGWPNFHICINPMEMDFYYGGAWTLIHQLETYYPGKYLINTNIASSYSGLGNNPSSFAHGLTTHYADITFVYLNESYLL